MLRKFDRPRLFNSADHGDAPGAARHASLASAFCWSFPGPRDTLRDTVDSR
jgi:hypothetical protein